MTKPFSFEGAQRRAIAEEALENLRDRVDSLITIPNDRLLSVIDRKTTLISAFRIVDDVLRQGVEGISDLITNPGEVNVDFADVRTIMQDSGSALMGIGVASGENRAVEAAKAAINSPLLELSIDGAKGVLLNISGPDITMLEVHEAANIITETIDPNAKVIFGTAVNDNIRKGELKITVVATGFDTARIKESPAGLLTRVPTSNNTSYGNPTVRSVRDEEENIPEPSIPAEDFGIPEERVTFPVRSIESTPLIIEEKIQPRSFSLRTETKEIAEDDDDLEIPAFIRRKMKK